MPKANIVVEGQTEETFVNGVLCPFILAQNNAAFIQPIVVETKRAYSGEKHSGGTVTYKRFRDDIRRALEDSGASCVTTFVDLFQLHSSFPAYQEASKLKFRERVAMLEQAMSNDLKSDRFLPYISTHEFEALLLCDPQAIVEASGGTKRELDTLRAHLKDCGSPEEINGNQPPSYRILSALPRYNKVLHGFTAARSIGILSMVDRCSHFGEWLGRLQQALT